MTEHSHEDHRSVTLERTEFARFTVRTPQGASIEVGEGDDVFSPVQLLLASIAACSAIDVDYIVSKREEPTAFTLTSEGYKIRDELGNRMVDITVTFDPAFSDSEEGREADGVVERAMQQSHDRLCTVTRTVLNGTDVTFTRA